MTTPATPSVDGNKVLDVREVPCSVKHGLILKTWYELPVGDHFILFNAHDPLPLRDKFETEFAGACTWEYLENGAEGVRIKITKVKPPAPGVEFGECGCRGH
jgi:uncharacterized protein (DUF2249 family)